MTAHSMGGGDERKLTPGEQATLRRRVEAEGVGATARALGVMNASLARALAGMELRRGTLALIRGALDVK